MWNMYDCRNRGLKGAINLIKPLIAVWNTCREEILRRLGVER
jgi:hypothetical protein